jgi:hypothetical protein
VSGYRSPIVSRARGEEPYPEEFKARKQPDTGAAASDFFTAVRRGEIDVPLVDDDEPVKAVQLSAPSAVLPVLPAVTRPMPHAAKVTRAAQPAPAPKPAPLGRDFILITDTSPGQSATKEFKTITGVPLAARVYGHDICFAALLQVVRR